MDVPPNEEKVKPPSREKKRSERERDEILRQERSGDELIIEGGRGKRRFASLPPVRILLPLLVNNGTYLCSHATTLAVARTISPARSSEICVASVRLLPVIFLRRERSLCYSVLNLFFPVQNKRSLSFVKRETDG